MVAHVYPTTGVMPGMNERRFNQQTQLLRAQFISAYNFVTATSGGASNVGNYFSISQNTNYAQFTGLFDQYRILEVEIWLQPSITQSVSTSQETGFFISCPDLDDAAASTVAALQLKPGAIQSPLFQSHYHRFQPRTATPSYQASAFSGYSVGLPGIWLDCAYPDIQHYGLKASTSTSVNTVVINATVRMTVEFRGV